MDKDTCSLNHLINKCKQQIVACLRKSRTDSLAMNEHSAKLFPSIDLSKSFSLPTAKSASSCILKQEMVEILRKHLSDDDIDQLTRIWTPEFSADCLGYLDSVLHFDTEECNRSFKVATKLPKMPEFELELERLILSVCC